MADNRGYDPFNSSSSIETLLEKRQEREKQEALLAEEVEQYKKVLNRLFRTEDGQYFLKKLVKYSGVYSFDKSKDALQDVREQERKLVFTHLIRPYLDKTILMEIV